MRFTVCPICGKPRPAPAPEMSDDMKLAFTLSKLAEKLAPLPFLYKARELLVPEAEAKGRREAFEAALAKYRSLPWANDSVSWAACVTILVEYLEQQLDACGPAKARPQYWGDHSKRCVLTEGHAGECVFKLTADDVEDFANGNLRVKVERMRIEIEQLKQERDELRAKLEEADKREHELAEFVANGLGLAPNVLALVAGRSGCEGAIRILREQKTEIERLTRELEAERKDAGETIGGLRGDLVVRSTEVVDLRAKLAEARKPSQAATPSPVTTALRQISVYRSTGTVGMTAGEWVLRNEALSAAAADQAAAVKDHADAIASLRLHLIKRDERLAELSSEVTETARLLHEAQAERDANAQDAQELAELRSLFASASAWTLYNVSSEQMERARELLSIEEKASHCADLLINARMPAPKNGG